MIGTFACSENSTSTPKYLGRYTFNCERIYNNGETSENGGRLYSITVYDCFVTANKIFFIIPGFKTETIFKYKSQSDYYVFAEEKNSRLFPYDIERIEITDNSIGFVHVESQTKKKTLVFLADYLVSENTPYGIYTFKHFTAKDLNGETVFETDTALTEEEIQRFGMNTDWYMVLDGIRLYQVNSTTEKKTLLMYYNVEDNKLISIYDENESNYSMTFDKNNIYFSIKITTFKNEKFVYLIKFGKN